VSNSCWDGAIAPGIATVQHNRGVSRRFNYGNAAWHGGHYGSSATAYGPNYVAHASNGYNPSTGLTPRCLGIHGVWKRSRRPAYNPHTGASASTVQASNAYGALEPRRSARTARPQIPASVERAWDHCIRSNTNGARLRLRRANGNMPRSRQTATSTSANGNVTKTRSGWSQTQGTPHNRTTPPVGQFGESGMEARKIGSSAWGGGGGSSGGNPGQRVLAVRTAAAGSADEPATQVRTEFFTQSRCSTMRRPNFLEGSDVAQAPQI
jgi:hypothetical protein